MHQTGKTRHQSRQIFDWFGCVSPLLVARLCSLRLSLALLRKRRDMRRRVTEAGCQRQEMQPDHGHRCSRLALRQPCPGEEAGATAALRDHVAGQRRVDTPSTTIGDVQRSGDGRRGPAGFHWKCRCTAVSTRERRRPAALRRRASARDESTLRMCKCNPRCAPPRTLLRCREQAPQRCRREGLHVRTERRFLARRLLVPDDR
jgi:hypothetical protein